MPIRILTLTASLALGGCVLAFHDADNTRATTTDDGEDADDGNDGSDETSSESGGSGDESSTGPVPITCGWGLTNDDVVPEGYVCGGDGEDPEGIDPLECPSDLRIGAPCTVVTGVGCCDENGDLWYCNSSERMFRESC